MRRVYSTKTWKYKIIAERVMLCLFLPVWVPFYLLMRIGEASERFLDFLESVLEKFLDMAIPKR